jgi:hypothetical protein
VSDRSLRSARILLPTKMTCRRRTLLMSRPPVRYLSVRRNPCPGRFFGQCLLTLIAYPHNIGRYGTSHPRINHVHSLSGRGRVSIHLLRSRSTVSNPATRANPYRTPAFSGNTPEITNTSKILNNKTPRNYGHSVNMSRVCRCDLADLPYFSSVPLCFVSAS